MKKYILLLVLCITFSTLSAQQNTGTGWQYKRIEWKKSHKQSKRLKVKSNKRTNFSYLKNRRIKNQRSCAAYR